MGTLKIGDLELIAGRKFENSVIRQHLSNSIDNMFAESNPKVIGYALVTLHEGDMHSTAWYATDSGINPDNLPDIAQKCILQDMNEQKNTKG
jgi:hypothetical protein